MSDPKKDAQKIAQNSLKKGNATGWFDPLYQKAKGDAEQVPWARMQPHPEFADWVRLHQPKGEGRKALVIGCGLGDDAEELAALGFTVTAFDISQTAIDWCHKRFPKSKVDYQVADLFDPPPGWVHGFDFVLEVYTIQSLPLNLRPDAIRAIAQFVEPGGHLLVVCHARLAEDDESRRARPGNEIEPSGPPWPVSREELKLFIDQGLQSSSFEENHNTGTDSPVWYRVEYRRLLG